MLTKDLNFEQYANDSCLLRRKDANGILYLIIYADDCFVIGNKQAIKKALDDVKKHFDIKRSGQISDFIGCSIERQGNCVLLSQRDLINKLIKTFKSKISNIQSYKTAATRGG